VAGSCKYGHEPSGSRTTELVSCIRNILIWESGAIYVASAVHSYNSYLWTNGTEIFQQNNYNKKPSLLLLTSIYDS
jgi:hypothetical protein